MKMKSIAARQFKYAGLMVAPQGEFSVKSNRDAKLLTAMRRAVIVPDDVPVKPTPKTVEKPAPKPAAKQAAKKESANEDAPPRAYKRRDMVAEEAPARISDEEAKPGRVPLFPDPLSDSADA